jgi:hypothetical protein
MGDLSKALGRFLTRDIFYVLSGLYLLSALSGVLGHTRITEFTSTFDTETTQWIVLIGSAYILGFTAKEVFAFCHFTIEPHWFKPSRFNKWLYRRHQRDDNWEPPPNKFQHEPIYRKISDAGKDVQSRYDRISDVIHMCSSTGAALLISGMIFLCEKEWKQALVAILGIVLILMARFQAIRRMQFMDRYK